MLSVVDYDKYDKIKEKIANQKKVLVGGCFDVIHFGHIEFLKKAKEQGDFLIIVLEPDEFIVTRKNRKPVHTQEERAAILSSIRYVDLVMKLPFFKNESDYTTMVSKIQPSIIAVTEGDSLLENKKKQAAKIGAEVKIVTPIIRDFSSSKIINHAALSSN